MIKRLKGYINAKFEKYLQQSACVVELKKLLTESQQNLEKLKGQQRCDYNRLNAHCGENARVLDQLKEENRLTESMKNYFLGHEVQVPREAIRDGYFPGHIIIKDNVSPIIRHNKENE